MKPLVQAAGSGLTFARCPAQLLQGAMERSGWECNQCNQTDLLEFCDMPTVANKRLQHNISKIFREGALLEDFAGNPTRSCDKVPRRISQDRDRRTFYRIIQRSSKILVRQEPERASRMIHTSTSSTTFTMTPAGPPQKGPLNAMTSGNILRGRCYNHRITVTTAIQHAPSDERVA